ncbi:MAG: TonB-dependent receptor [Proteobacteria bacterium]|nr:TonB-dependent receptor [Pseudomonadota bacterium]
MLALKPHALSMSVCVALLATSGVAHAQSTPTPAGQTTSTAATKTNATKTGVKEEPSNDADAKKTQTLQAITVSARGVDETLQRTPLPITAITQQMIQTKGLTDINDIAAITPSFSFDSPFGRNLSRPVIRGMSNILGAPNASFFIDGVFVQGDISEYGLQNIARVEVIRGPQSAEFGRGTFSGAVNFITAQPGAHPGTTVTLGVGNYGQHKEGVFTSARSDNGDFGIDLSAHHSHNDGMYYNSVSGEKDLGGRDTKSLMLAAYWAPTASLDITGRVMYQGTRDQMWPIARLGSSNSLNCYMPQYSGKLLYYSIPILDSRRLGAHCGEFSAPTSYGMNTDLFREAGYFSGTRYNYMRSYVRANYYFSNNWELSATTAYNTGKSYNGIDQDYSAIRGFGGAFESITETRSVDYSENIRLASDQSKPLSGMVGLYYYRQNPQPGYNGSLAGYYPPKATAVAVAPTNPRGSTIANAVYGMVKWDIDPHWTAALEARFARDELNQSGVDTQILGTTTYTLPYSLSKTNSNFTPRATLTYHLNDNINLYALASKGTKPGGFNLDAYRASLTPAARADLASRGLGTYDQSTVWSYEFGVKSELLDHRLRLNADVYRINWTGQQLTQGTPAQQMDGSFFATSYIANIGRSRINGLELESDWLFAENWQARFTYSYTDAKVVNYPDQGYADLTCPVPAPTVAMSCANASGKRLPLAPKQLASLGLTYTGHFANGWSYDANYDLTYHGLEYSGVDNNAIIPSSARSNLHFDLRPNDRIQISAYVTNLFNNHAPSGVLGYIDPTKMVAVPAIPPTTGYAFTFLRDYAISPSLPRMYGVEVHFKF